MADLQTSAWIWLYVPNEPKLSEFNDVLIRTAVFTGNNLDFKTKLKYEKLLRKRSDGAKANLICVCRLNVQYYKSISLSCSKLTNLILNLLVMMTHFKQESFSQWLLKGSNWYIRCYKSKHNLSVTKRPLEYDDPLLLMI